LNPGRHQWRNVKHRAQWGNTLKTYAFPVLASMDVSAVEVAHVLHVLHVLQPVWHSRPETASRLRGRIEAVLDYACAQGWRTGMNPARWKGLLDKVLAAPRKIAPVVHHRALDATQTRALMPVLMQARGTAALALRLLILTATRAGEMRGARWCEFDMDAALWVIPAQRMKAGREHRVPLGRQALALLRSVPRVHDD